MAARVGAQHGAELYSCSHDGTIRVWDSQSGQCTSCVEVGGEVDAMLIDSGFLFAGLKRCASATH